MIMSRAGRSILKADMVRLEGRYHLGIEKTSQSLAKEKNAASAIPQARIVESHPEFAVIEIICSCGAKTCLRCEYGGIESSVAGPGRDLPGAINSPDKKPD